LNEGSHGDDCNVDFSRDDPCPVPQCNTAHLQSTAIVSIMRSFEGEKHNGFMTPPHPLPSERISYEPVR
jgi:hypothetical protein